MEYFYDQQFRRYILQFIRIFSDLKIQVSPGTLRRVPIKYGDMSRMVGMILRENSQNTVMQAPHLSAWISNIEPAPERRQDPSFERHVRAIERHYDAELDAYTPQSGNRYSVKNYMPVPYTLTMQLDAWTTNTTDKFQIFEQILTVFNPSVQIQSNDNPLDWTSIFEVELTSINWSSRGVPAGVDSTNDIASLTFRLPVWITPPSMVTRQRVIKTIITNLYDGSVEEEETRGTLDYLGTCFTRLRQFVATPENLSIEVIPETSNTWRIKTVKSSVRWEDLFPTSGNVDVNGGLLTIKTDADIESTEGDIVGQVTVEGDDLIWDPLPETLPLAPLEIDAIIDPIKMWPGNGLPLAAAGQTYLLIDDSSRGRPDLNLIPEQPDGPWGSARGQEFDIIQFDGTEWNIVSPPAFLRNRDDQQYYRFTGTEWVYAFVGEHPPGFWRLEV